MYKKCLAILYKWEAKVVLRQIYLFRAKKKNNSLVDTYSSLFELIFFLLEKLQWMAWCQWSIKILLFKNQWRTSKSKTLIKKSNTKLSFSSYVETPSSALFSWKQTNEIDTEESIDKKRRPNRQSTDILTNGTLVKVESNDNLSIDPYYFEEFFTAIYNANINERAITEIFLFLPSRKVKHNFY
jgi:hypothetical protein